MGVYAEWYSHPVDATRRGSGVSPWSGTGLDASGQWIKATAQRANDPGPDKP